MDFRAKIGAFWFFMDADDRYSLRIAQKRV
jgi:hypothetical protein